MKPKTPQFTSNKIFRIQLDGNIQVVSVAGIPLILLKDNPPRAYIDNCPDEALPLEPALKDGGIICSHHCAVFNACSGSLKNAGRAHHPRRCQAGLSSVPVQSIENDLVEILITPETAALWRSVTQQRIRRQYGRGIVGLLRYKIAMLRGTVSEVRK